MDIFMILGVTAMAVEVGLCGPAICLGCRARGNPWRRVAWPALVGVLALGACTWFGAAAVWLVLRIWKEGCGWSSEYRYWPGFLLPALGSICQGAVWLGSWLILAVPGLGTVAWTERVRRESGPLRTAVAARLLADAGGLLLALAAALFVAVLFLTHASS